MIFVIILFLCRSIFAEENNVCVSFEDYYNNLYQNENCYFNPDVDLEVPRIIARNGYTVESHVTITKDGYSLTLFRIPYGRKSNTPNSFPVLLQHGMCINSVAFVDRGNVSLAFLLADAGFDVWLGNFRGTQYSKAHLYKDVDSPDYWNFSYHELGVYDVPAQLAAVSRVTQQKGNIIYVGFSMGTTAGYVYNTLFPEEASKTIKLFINMAPVAYVGNIKFFLKPLAFIWELWQEFVEGSAFQRAIFKRDPSTMKFMKLICLPYPIQMKLCWLSTMLLSGFDTDQMDPKTLPVTTIQHVDSTSMKVLSHYVQGVRSQTFSYYNYGPGTNLQVYGTDQPPLYNISAIRVPVYLIYANNDWLSVEKDVLRLYRELPNEVKQHGFYKVNWDSFTHSDFLTAKDVKTLVYDHIIGFLKSILHL